jgi:hypothetical protein
LWLMKPEATVPATTPATSAGTARRPKAIEMPAAMPDAGQNTARSEGPEINATPSRAARK